MTDAKKIKPGFVEPTPKVIVAAVYRPKSHGDKKK